jgi:DNA-binding NarL/FixJ family response regulator
MCCLPRRRGQADLGSGARGSGQQEPFRARAGGSGVTAPVVAGGSAAEAASLPIAAGVRNAPLAAKTLDSLPGVSWRLRCCLTHGAGKGSAPRGAVAVAFEGRVNIIVLTPVRLFGDGLAACLGSRPDMRPVAVLNDLESLRAALATQDVQVVLIDVTQGLDLFDVRGIAAEWPQVALVALGLAEQRQEVIRCGRAGFAGYVARDASIDALCKSLADVAAGKLACPPEIAGGLLRALYGGAARGEEAGADLGLTRREGEVLYLLGRGLSNKEIGHQLSLSVATVKHHVHHVLEKLGLTRRAEAMRRVHDAPWLAPRAAQLLRK